MDTSETYVKMCEKAEEIQTNDKRYNPDNQYNPDPDKTGLVIWLPRLDQLHEMIHTTDWISTLEKFTLFAFSSAETYSMRMFYGMGIPHNMFTMEQLWLAFCMSEKYNKVWSGTEWRVSI